MDIAITGKVKQILDEQSGTAFAWAAIFLTGRFPRALYGFGLGVLAWTVRVEAYILLLRDEYPPFTLRV
jgi:hypothetical protein